jgi:hypothetical protein
MHDPNTSGALESSNVVNLVTLGFCQKNLKLDLKLLFFWYRELKIL